MVEWREITGFEGRYAISENGDCKNIKTGRILKKRIRNRRVHYTIYKGSKIRHLLAHRLVAFAFIPVVEGKVDVNHIDGNPMNNHYSNLEWCTKKENTAHSYENHLQVPRYKVKPCEVIFIKMMYGSYRGSTRDLKKIFSISGRTIRNIILNTNRTMRPW